jgi:hypothetical protein
MNCCCAWLRETEKQKEEKSQMENAISLLNEQQASELLNCSVAALRRWRLIGAGPAYCRLGRLVRYRHADLEAFLDAQLLQTQPVAGGGR